MDPSSSPASSSLCLSLSTLTNSSSNTRTPQKKLKEACDLCSTFKLRCDKGKPACGRCLNLNQESLYSPARRAGRPHRLRQQQKQQQPPEQQQQQVQQQQQQQQQQLESFLNNSSCFNNNQPLSFAVGDFDWGNYDWGMEVEASGDDASSGVTAITSSSNHQIPTLSRGLDPALFTQPAIFSNPNKLGTTAQARLPASEPKEHTAQLSRHHQRPSFTGSWNDSGETALEKLPRQNHGDCFQTAVSIIEQLDPSCSKSKPLLPSENEPTRAGISTYCQRLLTILICPCSEQPVVALLVASGCLAMIDHVLHCSQQLERSRNQQRKHSSPPPPPPFSTSSGSSTASLNEYFKYAHASPPAPVQCEFEGLAKIAKVVLRFTQRYAHYEGPAGEQSHGAATTRALLEPIIIMLRSKLQCVTEEATGKVVL